MIKFDWNCPSTLLRVNCS